MRMRGFELAASGRGEASVIIALIHRIGNVTENTNFLPE